MSAAAGGCGAGVDRVGLAAAPPTPRSAVQLPAGLGVEHSVRTTRAADRCPSLSGPRRIVPACEDVGPRATRTHPDPRHDPVRSPRRHDPRLLRCWPSSTPTTPRWPRCPRGNGCWPRRGWPATAPPAPAAPTPSTSTAWLDWLHGLAGRRAGRPAGARRPVGTPPARPRRRRLQHRPPALRADQLLPPPRRPTTCSPRTRPPRSAAPASTPTTPPPSGSTATQARAFLAAADTDPGPARLRTAAAARLLLHLGLRVDELAAADTTDLGHDRGHRVLTVTRKGGRRATVVLPPATAAALDAYLTDRAHRRPDDPVDGPLLATTTRRPTRPKRAVQARPPPRPRRRHPLLASS